MGPLVGCDVEGCVALVEGFALAVAVEDVQREILGETEEVFLHGLIWVFGVGFESRPCDVQ